MTSTQIFSSRLSPVRAQSNMHNGVPAPPATSISLHAGESKKTVDAILELADGTAFRGISFGAEGKSIAGECVFQTGVFDLLFGMTRRYEVFVRHGRLYRVVDRSLV